MSRRRVLRLTSLTALVVVVIAVAVTAVTAVVLVRRPFPVTDGQVRLQGLDGTVTVARDRHGVPQIYADSVADLFRAQGYVQAQDRFFEMDWRRHVTSGRLAELLGNREDAIRADKVVRTLGWRRTAQAELDQVGPATSRALDAFARGVNDYLRGRSASDLSINYTLLGVPHTLPRIEPWSPLDSVAWFKAMAWDLRSNYTDELARARIFAGVRDVNRVQQLYPPYPDAEHAPILGTQSVQGGPVTSGRPAPPGTGAAAPAVGSPAASAAAGATRPQAAPRAQIASPAGVLGSLRDGGVQAAISAAERAAAAVPDLLGAGEGVGSNSWVISGKYTADHKPLLANDPHLALTLPGIWYQMGLHCRTVSAECPYDVAGFTFSGVPGIVIGHTGRFAWGMTNLGADVTDFYLEKVTGGSYELDGAAKPLTTRTETILVADSEPVTLTVRSTGHGPLLSDVLPEVDAAGARAPSGKGVVPRDTRYAVSLAWTAATPGHDMDAVLALDAATDFASFRAAVLQMDVPAQNFVYADVDGHIGYQAPGRIPVRRGADQGAVEGVPTDGSWPLPGWVSAHDWQGTVPTQDLPWVLDPAEGFLVAANQAVTGTGGKIHFTDDFDYGYRSQRLRTLIQDRITARRPVGVADLEAFQADTRNPLAAELIPLLRQVKLTDPFYAQAVRLLDGWDGTQATDSAAAAYFNAVWASLLDLTFADELPEGSRPEGGSRWFEVVRLLLKDPQDPWWDDRRTPSVVETRDEVLRQALLQARDRLTRILGKDPGRWQWGRLHRLWLTETPLGGVGATRPLHPVFNRGPLDLPGGSSIVNALGWNAASGTFDVTRGPSMRMVVDLGALDSSRWVNQVGESGHPGHSHYTDQLSAWAENRSFVWPFSKAAVDAATVDRLTLEPTQP